jgi:hypothetical protein
MILMDIFWRRIRKGLNRKNGVGRGWMGGKGAIGWFIFVRKAVRRVAVKGVREC